MAEILLKWITIHLMGTDSKQDPVAMKVKMNTALQCRAFVVWQWLAVLQKCHMDYFELPELPSFGEHFKKGIKQFNKVLFEEAVYLSNKESRLLEKVTGDDIAQVRMGILTASALAETQSENEVNDYANCPNSVTASCVFDQGK